MPTAPGQYAPNSRVECLAKDNYKCARVSVLDVKGLLVAHAARAGCSAKCKDIARFGQKFCWRTSHGQENEGAIPQQQVESHK